MSISVFQTVFYGCAQTIHFCFSSPIEIWKGVVVFQSIQLFVRGHFLPIQSSDVFTPTQYLPDKTLNLRKGNDIWLFSISVNRMVYYLEGIDDFSIQSKRYSRMKKIGLLLMHCILIGAKMRKKMLAKVIELVDTFLSCHWKEKIVF